MSMDKGKKKKIMKVLCLHGYRNSGAFLKDQLITKWGHSVLEHFEMVFPDGILPASGKSEIEGIFPPPYFEWFHFNEDFTAYAKVEEAVTYLCDYITKNGPFDGFLGFSQGAALLALLIGFQQQGKMLNDHPPVKFLISIAGDRFRFLRSCDLAYKDPIKVRSVHLIGDQDSIKEASEALASAFEAPLIIRHPQGHTIPRLALVPR